MKIYAFILYMDELATAPPKAYSKPLGWLKTGFRGSPTQAPKAAYHRLSWQLKALKIYAFILYMDELAAAPPKAYSKPLGCLNTGHQGSLSQLQGSLSPAFRAARLSR